MSENIWEVLQEIKACIYLIDQQLNICTRELMYMSIQKYIQMLIAALLIIDQIEVTKISVNW